MGAVFSASRAGSPLLISLLSPLDNRLLAAKPAFAVNAGAYTAESIRARILPIHLEQMDAARAIGMAYPPSTL
ncbi:hypothetical protein [Acerihabitans arboris]|uniref:Uncharacterized protein n=1 Tax=Acerihabitans arboris TaxID=2691583 RepID=A0A845SFN2_9GAMM|nr:hypothetical protein [Acerihabitans arboris]NDL63843.1 hypothetical protein [Acerihabitans arboris]